MAASHWRSGLLVGMSPKRRMSSGCERLRATAGDVVVGRDDQRAVVWPAAELRGGLGEDRIARRRGQRGHRLGELGVRLAAGDDQAARRALDPLGEPVEQSLVRLAGSRARPR